jgi:hypothetical protein
MYVLCTIKVLGRLADFFSNLFSPQYIYKLNDSFYIHFSSLGICMYKR